MSWLEIISLAFNFVLAGGLTLVGLLPQKRKEAQLENQNTLIKQYQELIDNIKKDLEIAKLERDEYKNETKRLRDKKNFLTIENTHLKIFRCDCIDCSNRIPPIGGIAKLKGDVQA